MTNHQPVHDLIEQNQQVWTNEEILFYLYVSDEEEELEEEECELEEDAQLILRSLQVWEELFALHEAELMVEE